MSKWRVKWLNKDAVLLSLKVHIDSFMLRNPAQKQSTKPFAANQSKPHHPMTPKQEVRIRNKIVRIRKELAANKKRWGGEGDAALWI